MSRIFVASKIHNIGNVVKTQIKAVGDICVNELTLAPDGLLSEESIKQIPDINILFADPGVIGQVLCNESNSVKWIQNTFAGVDAIMKAIQNLKSPPEVLLTRQTAGFGQFMGEYVLGHVIARERRFSDTVDLQRENNWNQRPYLQYRGLNDLNLGILGLGNIGQEVARMCAAMHMTVWAAVRDARYGDSSVPSWVSHVRPMSRLSELLESCDYVVNVLPSTPETRGLLNGEVLKSCQAKKSVFINIGRGDVIDDESLINAVQSGWLSGAILDVFNTEPLPPSSPLWSLSGVTVTPHVSGATNVHSAVKTFIDNLIKFQQGDPLMNVVDIAKGY